MKHTKASQKEKHAGTHTAGWWMIRIIMILLALALVGSVGYNVYLNYRNHQLGHTAKQQSQTIDGLNSQLQEGTKQQEQITSEKESLQSQIAQKDQQIASYQEDLQTITSQYNALVKTKLEAKPTTSAPNQLGVTAVTEKTCYLTFDDGPSDNTLKILDILKQRNIKATFFVVGTAKLPYIKQIHEEGHTVALHTYTHEFSQIYASTDAYFADLDKIGQAVESHIGFVPQVIRFPGGSSNTASKKYCQGIMTTLAKETANRGYVYYDWNVDSTDASGNRVSVSKILSNIKTYGGKRAQEVVLMHDTASKTTTVEALPDIIDFYIEKGYTFAPITTNTPQVTHGIKN